MQIMTRLAARCVLLYTIIPYITSVVAQEQICNNAASLCNRTYDNVTHLGAHDSPFVRNSTNQFSGAGDQFYTSLQQLNSGIRLLSAQVHAVVGNDSQTEWRLCHTLCQLYDAGYLLDWLKDIRGWLDQHPNDVVTILLVNSDNANASTLGDIYTSAGLDQYSYVPTSTTSIPSEWPTLKDMITRKTRLVNFIASLNPTTNQVAPYLLDEFTYVFENNYENILPSSFSCEPQRPTPLRGNTRLALSGRYLPLMNHFRYDNISGIEIPSVENVNVTNALSGGAGNLGDAAANCSQIYGRAPTFILTDFTNVGRAYETIDRLNGVEGQTSGRLVLPDTTEESIADPSPSSSAVSSTAVSSRASGSTTTTSRASAAATSSSSSSSSIKIDPRVYRSEFGVSILACTIMAVIAMLVMM